MVGWVGLASEPVVLIGCVVNLEQLLTTGVHRSDLIVVDEHFTKIGIQSPDGFTHLKAALIALASVADFEL